MTDGIGGMIHRDQDHKQRKATFLQRFGHITWIEWEGKKRDMVRPSVTSLNSLVKIIREISPLCAENHSSINHLGEDKALTAFNPQDELNFYPNGEKDRKHENTTPLTYYELGTGCFRRSN